MSLFPLFRTCALLAAIPVLGAVTFAAAGKTTKVIESDIAPTEARQGALSLGARLSHPTEPPPIPASLKTPFEFDRTDPDPTPTANGAPAPSRGNREILEAVADFIKPSGVTFFRNQPIVSFGNKPLKIGTKFTVNLPDGTQPEVELTSATTTSFTLRYKDQETTRPIVPKK